MNNANTARYSVAASKVNYSSVIAAGGYSAPPAGTGIYAATEEWNGVSWVEVADLNTGRQTAGSAGTSTSGIVFGGFSPSLTAATEEWSGSSIATKTISTD